jgi:hypothetical protein
LDILTLSTTDFSAFLIAFPMAEFSAFHYHLDLSLAEPPFRRYTPRASECESVPDTCSASHVFHLFSQPFSILTAILKSRRASFSSVRLSAHRVRVCLRQLLILTNL